MSAATVSSSTTITILGGIPTHADLAPAIIFVILYAALVPLLFWRLTIKATRDTVLIRPAIFILLRIACWIMRAIQSEGNYSEGLFIASQVFLLIGFVFIADGYISAFNRYIDECRAQVGKGHVINRLSSIFKLCLIGVIVTGIYAGSIVGDAFSDPNGSDASTLKTLRLVNYILSIVVCVALVAGVIFSHINFGTDTRRSAYIIGGSLCLFVVSLYKLLQSQLPTSATWIHTSSCFWVLLATFEWIATLLTVAIDYPALFPKVQKTDDEDEKGFFSRFGSNSKINSQEGRTTEYTV